MSKRTLRIVEPGDPPPLPKHRPPAREVAADIWWHAVTLSAVVSGLLYLGVCIGLIVPLLNGPREPLEVLLRGLALSLVLLAGIGIWQRLASPPRSRDHGPAETPVVGVYEHHHIHRYEDR